MHVYSMDVTLIHMTPAQQHYTGAACDRGSQQSEQGHLLAHIRSVTPDVQELSRGAGSSLSGEYVISMARVARGREGAPLTY